MVQLTTSLPASLRRVLGAPVTEPNRCIYGTLTRPFSIHQPSGLSFTRPWKGLLTPTVQSFTTGFRPVVGVTRYDRGTQLPPYTDDGVYVNFTDATCDVAGVNRATLDPAFPVQRDQSYRIQVGGVTPSPVTEG